MVIHHVQCDRRWSSGTDDQEGHDEDTSGIVDQAGNADRRHRSPHDAWPYAGEGLHAFCAVLPRCGVRLRGPGPRAQGDRDPVLSKPSLSYSPRVATVSSAADSTRLVTRHRIVVTFLLLGLVASWFVLMATTSRNVYVEPTDLAMRQAAAARPAGMLAATVQVSLAVAVAWATQDRWIVVLGLPGLLAGGWLLLVPSSHGAAWTFALLSSLPALAVAVFRAVRRRVEESPARARPGRTARPLPSYSRPSRRVR